MQTALRELIDNDLYNELRWLLCAATEWDADRKLQEQPCFRHPFHLSVYTMDSALLHARSLYEFFTATEPIRPERRTWRDYSRDARQESDKYNEFIKPLHGRVMHLNRDRDGYDPVKDEVVNFASDILRLWDDFSKKPGLGPYAGLLQKYRKQAIDEAADVAKQYSRYGFSCPFR